MAIALVGSNFEYPTGTSTSNQSVQVPLTIPVGTKALVLMCIYAPVTNPQNLLDLEPSFQISKDQTTYYLTIDIKSRAPTNPECESFISVITNPPTGSCTLNTIANSKNYKVWISFVGADLDIVVGAKGNAGGVSTNPNFTLSGTKSNSMIFSVIASGANAWAPTGRSGTQIFDRDVGTWGGGCQYQPGQDGQTVVSWTFGTSDDWGISSIELIEAYSASLNITTGNVGASAQASCIASAGLDAITDSSYLTADAEYVTLSDLNAKTEPVSFDAYAETGEKLHASLSASVASDITAEADIIVHADSGLQSSVSTVIDAGAVITANAQALTTLDSSSHVGILATADVFVNSYCMSSTSTNVHVGASLFASLAQANVSSQSSTNVAAVLDDATDGVLASLQAIAPITTSLSLETDVAVYADADTVVFGDLLSETDAAILHSGVEVAHGASIVQTLQSALLNAYAATTYQPVYVDVEQHADDIVFAGASLALVSPSINALTSTDVGCAAYAVIGAVATAAVSCAVDINARSIVVGALDISPSCDAQAAVRIIINADASGYSSTGLDASASLVIHASASVNADDNGIDSNAELGAIPELINAEITLLPPEQNIEASVLSRADVYAVASTQVVSQASTIISVDLSGSARLLSSTITASNIVSAALAADVKANISATMGLLQYGHIKLLARTARIDASKAEHPSLSITSSNMAKIIFEEAHKPRLDVISKKPRLTGRRNA